MSAFDFLPSICLKSITLFNCQVKLHDQETSDRLNFWASEWASIDTNLCLKWIKKIKDSNLDSKTRKKNMKFAHYKGCSISCSVTLFFSPNSRKIWTFFLYYVVVSMQIILLHFISLNYFFPTIWLKVIIRLYFWLSSWYNSAWSVVGWSGLISLEVHYYQLVSFNGTLLLCRWVITYYDTYLLPYGELYVGWRKGL